MSDKSSIEWTATYNDDGAVTPGAKSSVHASTSTALQAFPAQGADRKKPTNHIIGHARTIRTAVLVCEYLRLSCAKPHSSIHPDQVTYRFTDPTPQNGCWSADIIIVAYAEPLHEETTTRFVRECRAFVAGAGEVWA